MLTATDFAVRHGSAHIGPVSATFGTGVSVLLGPNGAGKSTLLEAWGTLTPHHDGEIAVGGTPVADVGARRTALRSLGMLSQGDDLIDEFRVEAMLRYAGWLSGLDGAVLRDRTAATLERWSLNELRRSRIRRLSGGQRQRVRIACALVHEPEILLLDEPTVALDPQRRAEFRETLGQLAEDHVVVLTTHLISDIIETGATQIVVLDAGAVRFRGTPAELSGGAVTAANLERGYLARVSGGAA